MQSQPYSYERINEVPILGRVQAGLPVLAEENIEGTVPLPRDWARDDKVFLLRVKGDSMKDAHILSGDLALIRQQPTAENGEIVVARLHHLDATLKRFYRRAKRVVLRAENPKYEPIDVAGDEVEVIGKLSTRAMCLGISKPASVLRQCSCSAPASADWPGLRQTKAVTASIHS